MITVNDCKVRYLVGSPYLLNEKYRDYGDSMRKALKDLSDLLPPYLMLDEDDRTYVYFMWEPDESLLRMLRGMIVYHDCFWLSQKEDLA